MKIQYIYHDNNDFESFYIDQYGNKIRHSVNEQPAEIIDGWQIWYSHNQIHRDNDLPAVVESNGNKHWYNYGKLHRGNDLPAIELPNGSKFWYKNGRLHRSGNKPAVIHHNSCIKYYVDGKHHRDNYNLPSIIDIKYEIFEFYYYGNFIKEMTFKDYNAQFPELNLNFDIDNHDIINYIQMDNLISELYDMDAM